MKEWSFQTNTLYARISSQMGCGHGARDNLLSPTIKWSEPMLYKLQRLSAGQRLSEKKGESKRYVRAD